MPATTISSRQFNQDTAAAKRAARQGPVIITDRGHPAYVLLTNEEYERLSRPRLSIADAFRMPGGGEDIEFDPPENKTVRAPFDFD